ncbi:MAG: hypothetical protein ABL871_09595 [Terricaulis sp.]
MATKSAEQANTERNWRDQLRDMQTWPEFTDVSPSMGKLKDLSEGALQAAAQNPDHSAEARALAAAELNTRGIAERRWRIKAPSFITARDLERRGVHLFFGWYKAVADWCLLGLGVCLVVLLVGIVSAELSSENPNLWALTRGEGRRWEGGAFFAYAFLWLSAVYAVMRALRPKPARVLLLRKFDVEAIAKPLKEMIWDELSEFGHVISLSDRYIQPERLVWVGQIAAVLTSPIVGLGYWLLLPFRLIWRIFDRSTMGEAIVSDAHDYRNLARRLRDLVGLNVQVALATDEHALLVRSSDRWWKLVVQLLIDSCDVIVVDASQIAPAAEWELDVIRDWNAAGRCVFVARGAMKEQALAALKRRHMGVPCFYYDEGGDMEDRAAFRAAMVSAMRVSHGLPA